MILLSMGFVSLSYARLNTTNLQISHANLVIPPVSSVMGLLTPIVFYVLKGTIKPILQPVVPAFKAVLNVSLPLKIPVPPVFLVIHSLTILTTLNNMDTVWKLLVTTVTKFIKYHFTSPVLHVI